MFGCFCYPFLRPYNHHKLEYRSSAATFIGYSSHHKGYKVLLDSGKVIVSRDVLFDETIFPQLTSTFPNSHTTKNHALYLPPIPIIPHTSPVLDTLPPVVLSSPTSTVPVPDASLTHLPESSDPPRVPVPDASHLPESSDPPPLSNASSHPMITRAKAGIFKPKALTITLSSSTIPKSALIVLLIPVWKQAMVEEFMALLRNKTWTLTVLPPGKNLVGCSWIFRIKKHADGSIARHKARLVAQGFSQEPGFDFTETFSPVVKPTTIRLILSIAVSAGWSVKHLDVNNAFLHGDLDQEIYMKQPLGFEQGSPNLVCKLNKALYGLKQASRSWFLTVQSVLISLGFTQSRADTSLFFRSKGSEVTYLLVYVDDMLITGSSSSSVPSLQG